VTNHLGMIKNQSSPKFIRRLMSIAVLSVLFSPVHTHAVTILNQVQTISFTPIVNTDYNYSGFLKFDTKLGTLRAVTLKLNSLNLSGSFIYNQGSSGSSVIKAINMDILFYAASSLNNTAHDGLIANYDVGNLPKTGSVSIVNQVLPKTIASKDSVLFNLGSGQNILTTPVVVLNLTSDTDLAFYKGSGISFAPAFTSITQFLVTGSFTGSPTRDYNRLRTLVNMSLTYDYTPPAIPEPSYYGLGIGLATAGYCLRRRYSKNKCRIPS